MNELKNLTNENVSLFAFCHCFDSSLRRETQLLTVVPIPLTNLVIAHLQLLCDTHLVLVAPDLFELKLLHQSGELVFIFAQT
jgi:hypothetical protein